MGTLVWHKVRGVWTSNFKTELGAKRFAKKKYPNMIAGEPMGWGRGYEIYVHKKTKFDIANTKSLKEYRK